MSKYTYAKTEAKKLSLDEKDKTILSELHQNARISYALLAEKTKIQRDTITKRVEKMKKNGLILGYDITLDPYVLGYAIFAHIFIKLLPIPKEDLEDFNKKLFTHPNITHITKILGNFDLVLTIAAKDSFELEKIVNDIKQNPKQIIQNLEIATIIGESKINDFSGIISA
jgi:Lrp/AsnC family leucine-responsive transcriptional regulator